MKLSIAFAIPTSVVFLGARSCVQGFSTSRPAFISVSRRRLPAKLVVSETKASHGVILFGILDDLLEEENATEADGQSVGSIDDPRMVDLYHSLIFSSDLKNEIAKRLNDCTDPNFLEYLTASSKSTSDKDEEQGLLDLIGQITEVKANTEKAAVSAAADEMANKDMEIAVQADETESPPTKPLSNADILRKANEIDAAIALSDEEKPSDFISDCREVVNLSRGFNDSGQMRVGGG